MNYPDESTLDLFTPLVPEERWHPNFARIKASTSDQELDALTEWARGFRDRDGKFVKEFQTTFNSSFWELYLHALFRKAGCTLDQSHSRPDFVITDGPLGLFTAEAVIASNPQHNLPEWASDPTHHQPREFVLDLACLRLSQAIAGKHDKWTDGYSSLSHCSGYPFVVCVSPFEQPWASLQGTEAIDRVLFKGPRPIISSANGEPRVFGHTISDRVFKPSGASVELGIFTTPKYSAISAVLFSSLATWSKIRSLADLAGRLIVFTGVRLSEEGLLHGFVEKGNDYIETIEDGANLFLNPFADIPLEPDPFFEFGLGVHLYSGKGTLTRVPKGGLLVCRTTGEIRVAPERTEPHSPPPGATQHVPSRPPDDTPFAGPSRNPLTGKITLELHLGWTLYVGQDLIDKDWAVLGKRLVCLSLNEFVNTSMEPHNEFMTGFFPTRDAAVAEARRQITTMESPPDGA